MQGFIQSQFDRKPLFKEATKGNDYVWRDDCLMLFFKSCNKQAENSVLFFCKANTIDTEHNGH